MAERSPGALFWSVCIWIAASTDSVPENVLHPGRTVKLDNAAMSREERGNTQALAQKT